MPRSVAVSVENSFKAGLITEASGLNFPENACTDTENCEFDLLGRVSRRAGIDLEAGFATKTIDRSGSVIATYLWRNVTGDGTISFVVQQIGTTLFFWNAQSTNAISIGAESGNIDLTAFQTSGSASPRLAECQFADGLGKLFVVHPGLDAFFVVFTPASDVFTATKIDLTIRDLQGMAESPAIPVDFRPTADIGSTSVSHHYNLLNQGWGSTVGAASLATWDAGRSDLPSNADVWWLYKNSSDAFDLLELANFDPGTTPAPKGHFVLNLFNQNRSAASGVIGITSTSTDPQRASAVAFFAGRVFYAGINAVDQFSKIYFTQIIERNDQLGACYQKQDLTSETTFDLLPDDGGFISIPEAGTIYKLFPMQAALLVFAYRGVWAITGSSSVGFSATDYTVSKISDYRAVSNTSFVSVNGAPIWWNTDGIFTAQGNANAVGGATVQSLSFTTIQSFYDLIPNESKQFARGYFNPVEQVVHWLYKSTRVGTLQESYEFDKVLTLNILTGAFYPWSIGHGSVKIHGLVVTDAVGGQITEANVIDTALETVIDGAGDTIVSLQLQNAATTQAFKYLVSFPDGAGSWKFTYADVRDVTYKDFSSFDSNGVDFDSFFITGYKTHGEAQRRFQPNYVILYNEGTGSYYVQGIWNFANTGSGQGIGLYTSRQKVVYTDETVNAAHKKVKIRGNGYTLQYFITSVPGEPFTLLGWSTQESANART